MRGLCVAAAVLTVFACGDSETTLPSYESDTIVVVSPDAGLPKRDGFEQTGDSRAVVPELDSRTLEPDSQAPDPCDKEPVWTAVASGIVEFTYQHKPGCYTGINTTGYQTFSSSSKFSHVLAPNGATVDPAVSFQVQDINSVPSGKVFSIPPPLDQVSVIFVSVSKRNPSLSCSSICFDSSPYPGTMSFTYANTTDPNNVKIRVDGYLCCQQGTKREWRHFKYTVSGVN